MVRVSYRYWLVVLSCIALGAMVHPARGSLTAPEKNLEMLGETLLATNDMLQAAGGPTLDDNMAFTGTFDSSGFTYHLTGTFAGDAIDLSATGVYDSMLEQISYTGGGSVGSETWSQSGQVSITPLSPTVTDFAGNHQAHAPPHIVNGHLIEERNWHEHDNGDGTDTDSYDLYIDGHFKSHETSFSHRGGRQGGYESNNSSVIGTIDYGAGTFNGFVIPEPGTIVLACVGGIPLIVAALRRRRRRCAS